MVRTDKDPIMTAQKKDSRSLRWFTSGALLLALIAFVISHICATRTQLVLPKSMGADEFSVLPNQTALNIMSLGYKPFVADLIWLRALQYNNLKNEAHLAEMFSDAIISLDPDFEPIYRYAAVNALFSEDISADSVERANHYLLLGLERFPTKAYYPYTIAMNYMSYYPADGPMPKAERRKKTIYYLQQAMQKSDAQKDISMLISGLLKDDSDSAKIKFLQQAVLTENDPQTKRFLQTRLIFMTRDAGDDATLLNARKEAWRQKHRTYLPNMLDYLISYQPAPLQLFVDNADHPI